MASITQATTVAAVPHGSTMRYRFRYVLNNGETHERIAWVPSGTSETEERDRRGQMALAELAEAEIARELG